MQIALAQINPILGDIKGNTKKIISLIKKTNADLIAFPELSITGYSPQDLLLKKSFIEDNLKALDKIRSSAKKSAIIGFVDKSNNEIFNSSAVIQNRKIIAVHHKICLPNYAVFDEKRWFTAGNKATIFELNGKKIGLTICEDIWHADVTKKSSAKADFLINISASPYENGKIEEIEDVLKQRFEENKKPILYVNQVGAQDGIVYYGHSMYFNEGKVIKKAKDFEEDVLIMQK